MMIKYPSIDQFRHVIKSVKAHTQYAGKDDDGIVQFDRSRTLPVLNFHGTVKLHGTNSSIVVYPDGNYKLQSRNRTITDGHFGFVEFVHNLGGAFVRNICTIIGGETPVTIYGEWCGEGIQKNIGISKLKKMFVIFGIRVGDIGECIWVRHDSFHELLMDDTVLNEKGIYHINQFPAFNVTIDFNKPELVQNTLVEYTEEVERECPVAKYFGISGVGEGIVWKCVDSKYLSSDYWFKVKGEKHSVTKVKTLAAVDIEKIKAIDEFVDKTVTINRLNQGIDYLKEMGKEIEQRSTGDFLSWIFKDVMKEEADTLEASGFDRKDIGKPIGTKARKWFFEYLDEQEI